MYIGFKMFFYVVRHLDSTASYLPTGLPLGFFRSWQSLYRPSSFSSVFLVLSFVSASTAMLFWVIFLLPFSEYGGEYTVQNLVVNYNSRANTCFTFIRMYLAVSQTPRHVIHT